MIRIILLIVFFPLFSKSVELNLICTNTVKNYTIDVKDMFVNINSDSKPVELGGLDFYAKEMKLNVKLPSLGLQRMLSFIQILMVL